jgi:hypothetical protein
VRLNDKRHAVVQRGVPLTYRKGLGTVNQQCAYSIVGAGGRSFANPVVKVAAPQVTPVAITVPAPVVRPAPLVITPVSRVAPIAPVGGGSKADIAKVKHTSRSLLLLCWQMGIPATLRHPITKTMLLAAVFHNSK